MTVGMLTNGFSKTINSYNQIKKATGGLQAAVESFATAKKIAAAEAAGADNLQLLSQEELQAAYEVTGIKAWASLGPYIAIAAAVAAAVGLIVVAYKEWNKHKVFFRVKDYTWWERESKPTEIEIQRGWENLKKKDYTVNLILTHCLPWSVQSSLPMYRFREDEITGYLQEVSERVRFKNWICGHYHQNMTVMSKYHILYEQIIQIA